MQIASAPLKPLADIPLTPDEGKMLGWIRSAAWEPVKDAHEPIPYKAKVPEFYSGVRLYNMQTGGTRSAFNTLELFIKKLQMLGAIGKQEMYPLSGHGSARYLSLKKADLNNLGVGKEEEEE